MSYDSYFETGVTRAGFRYVAYWDGEHCGEYDTHAKAARAVALRDKADKAAQELDKASRPYFCDGRYGAWRAIEYGQALPPKVETAFQRHHAASMALARHRGLA